MRVNITAEVRRIHPLLPVDTSGIDAAIQILQATYQRKIPQHYLENPLTSEFVHLNAVLVEGGQLVIPTTLQTTFARFFAELSKTLPELHKRIISPVGTARLAAGNEFTPIKIIASLTLGGVTLPGDRELYGWDGLAREAAEKNLRLVLAFQGNGLYFNRGSAIFSPNQLVFEPDGSLAELFCSTLSVDQAHQMGIRRQSMKRPLPFFVQGDDARVHPSIFNFTQYESYADGLSRLADWLKSQPGSAGFAASPPLLLPHNGGSNWLTLAEILSGFHANDVRHYLYCPYHGAVLLYPELSRAQSLHPARLTRSLSGQVSDRVCLPLRETLAVIPVAELVQVLNQKGYRGRFHLRESHGQVHLYINPLPGVYSHLLPFVTSSGGFGLLQTSGTHRNITGNDGATIHQLLAILKDIAQQEPFLSDPFQLIVTGAQGNDVSNLILLGKDGVPGLVGDLAPIASLDNDFKARGTVTTPRLGIALPG